MFFTIYKIVNKVNGKYYIGKHKTNDLNDGYMGSGILIRRAILKYGEDNFTKEILHIFDNEKEMNNKEKELVVISEQTYNLCEGGQGGFSYINRNKMNTFGAVKGGKNSAKKLINKRKNDPQYDEEYRKKLSVGQINRHKNCRGVYIPTTKGYKHTDEAKQLLREKNLGKKNSQFGTMWITNGQENKKIKKEELDFWIQIGYNKGRK